MKKEKFGFRKNKAGLLCGAVLGAFLLVNPVTVQANEESTVVDQQAEEATVLSEELASEVPSEVEINDNVEIEPSVETEPAAQVAAVEEEASVPEEEADSVQSPVVISEVESDDPEDGNDWVEIQNQGQEAFDVSGWYVTDDKGYERVESGEAWPFEEGTIIEPSSFLVLEDGTHFDFGLGKNDAVNLHDRDGQIVDSFSWDGLGHANGTYSLVDGTFVDQASSKGTSNDQVSEEPLPEENDLDSNGIGTPESTSDLVINEIESDDPEGGPDWVEFYNTGSEAIDVSGWYMVDDKGRERVTEEKTWGLPDGTLVEPGAFLVLEEDQNFDFGLGKGDSVTLYNSNDELVTSFTYPDNHALGTYGRREDGQGPLFDLAEATKGAANTSNLSSMEEKIDEVIDQPQASSILINEVDSNPGDFVELINPTDEAIDISRYEIRDSDDDHRFQIAEGTVLEAGGLYVVYTGDSEATAGLRYDDVTQTYVEGLADFGLGSSDEVRLFNPEGELIDQFAWTQHAAVEGDTGLASYGRYPHGTGSFYLVEQSPEAENVRLEVKVAINEVESNDPQSGPDWIEIVNHGDFPVDISGWFVLDDKGIARLESGETTPLEDQTILQPGEFYIFEENDHFTFGIGKEDVVTLMDASGIVIDHMVTGADHAEGTLQRIPNGTGDFVDLTDPSKGEANSLGNPVLINEVESDAPDGGEDWIELYNPRQEELDISGLVVQSGQDEEGFTIPDGTVMDPQGYIVFTQTDFGFDLGESDALRIFDGEEMVQELVWDEHAENTLGRRSQGEAFGGTSEATPGARNEFTDIPSLIEWPGSDTIEVFDQSPTFLTDSSGLDFADGQLYVLDNGTGKFWILDVAEDGSLSMAPGFENGKRVRYAKDAENPEAAGPDSEGITVAESGLVYIASERDNEDKNTNYSSILVVDPTEEGEDLIAIQEWDLTQLLPEVSANMGLEAVEWVANEDLEGLLFDTQNQKPYEAADYPNAIENGLFFTALENDGKVYVFALNDDETANLVSVIDPQIGGSMGLDYEEATDTLWVLSDNGYNNILAQITLNGTEQPDVTHVEPPQGIDRSDNNEGFAIASLDYTLDGSRPVYWIKDGPSERVLQIGSIDTVVPDDEEEVPGDDEEPTSPTTPDPDQPSDQDNNDGTDDQQGNEDTDSSDRPTDSDQGSEDANSEANGQESNKLDSDSQSSSDSEDPASEGDSSDSDELPQTGITMTFALGAASILTGLGLAADRRRK